MTDGSSIGFLSPALTTMVAGSNPLSVDEKSASNPFCAATASDAFGGGAYSGKPSGAETDVLGPML